MFVVPENKTEVIETPFKYNDVKFPEQAESDTIETWNKFFKEFRPYPIRVRQGVMRLHREKKHPAVIACLQSAMTHGQAQPWMYEVLALSMEIENYPKSDIERVVLSLSDFGGVTFENLMYSAAYLKRFDRQSAALRLYQEASRLSSERPEPYVLALPLADAVGTPADVQWAAEGILQHYWGTDYVKKHRSAEDAVFNRLRFLKREGMEPEMKSLAASLQQARSRDLMIRVEWSGQGDLDLQVEEPPGSICSFESPLTYAGGIFLHDGSGPDQSECYESYVCPQGVTGPYRVRVKNAFGSVVGDRAVVTVTMHTGLPSEEKVVRTVVLNGGEASFTIDLLQGRRTQPRNLSLLQSAQVIPVLAEDVNGQNQVRRVTREHSEVIQDFAENRLETSPRRAGAVGYTPVVQTIPEGSSLSAQAVVSPDRRYVRLSMRPTFTTITDVFTFSFLNNNGTVTGTGGN